MFEIADRLLDAVDSGRRLAVATAVAITGSAPRTVGTSMAFDGSRVIGSIAGGCVEGAVVDACEEVLADGIPRTIEFGVDDETAFSVGLTCGGQLRIHISVLTDAAADQLRLALSGAAAGIVTMLGSSTGPSHQARLDAELAARIALGDTGLDTLECEGELVEAFFEVSVPPARMIIFGAMEFSAALAAAARAIGYRVTVCDPRPLFATSARFPDIETIVAWPTVWLPTTPVDDRTVICVLSHDARFDAELIAQALELPVAFVGAMGSRRTHERRVASLRERGVAASAIARLHSPIGLDIGASTVEETAIAILAEVIQARAGGSGESLKSTAGAIHRPVAARVDS